MVGGLLKRGRQTQHLVCLLARRSFDRDEPRAADRQRPGLVEHDGVGPRKRLERAPAFDENAKACGARDAGDESNRRRQDQRAWRRGDEDGKAANGIARPQPRRSGDQQRNRQENQRVAIGDADERRLRRLRRRHHANDAGIGARAGGGGRLQLEGFAGVDRPAAGGFALVAAHGNGLPGQSRLVERGGRAEDDAVDGNDLASAHEYRVADRHGVDRNVFDHVMVAPVRDSWRAIDERFEVALGAGDGEVFEQIAASVHHGNYGAG